jgi:hypothetical protein
MAQKAPLAPDDPKKPDRPSLGSKISRGRGLTSPSGVNHVHGLQGERVVRLCLSTKRGLESFFHVAVVKLSCHVTPLDEGRVLVRGPEERLASLKWHSAVLEWDLPLNYGLPRFGAGATDADSARIAVRRIRHDDETRRVRKRGFGQ